MNIKDITDPEIKAYVQQLLKENSLLKKKTEIFETDINYLMALRIKTDIINLANEMENVSTKIDIIDVYKDGEKVGDVPDTEKFEKALKIKTDFITKSKGMGESLEYYMAKLSTDQVKDLSENKKAPRFAEQMASEENKK